MIRRTFQTLTVAVLFSTNIADSAQAESETYPNAHLLVDASELAQTSGELDRVILDIRSAKEFNSGHIPGAMQLDPNAVVEPGGPIDGDLRPISEISDLLGNIGIDSATEVILYDDRGGFHAARMFWLLEYLGHKNVRLLNGGLEAWREVEQDLTTDETRIPMPKRFVPAIAARRAASADWILERQHDENVEVLDVRPGSIFEQGHIPWATNLPWAQNLNAAGSFRPAAELRVHFEAAGVDWDDRVVVHCQNGLASSHSYVALRLLGHPNVRTYHRSWAEWGDDKMLPSATGSDG
ncbi:sulfurtransferase [Roseobacter sp. EG26]|uniref:sulfurtransferase n=1 Tax=Roseobacter sp. EG26 TaxID=3412477 RepID=UPI003CE5BA58